MEALHSFAPDSILNNAGDAPFVGSEWRHSLPRESFLSPFFRPGRGILGGRCQKGEELLWCERIEDFRGWKYWGKDNFTVVYNTSL